MYGWGHNVGTGRTIRILKRATPYAKRSKRKRARTGLPERPVGPKLVRGRGLRRRRIDPMRWVSVTVYLLIACAILSYVVPRLPFGWRP